MLVPCVRDVMTPWLLYRTAGTLGRSVAPNGLLFCKSESRASVNRESVNRESVNHEGLKTKPCAHAQIPKPASRTRGLSSKEMSQPPPP